MLIFEFVWEDLRSLPTLCITSGRGGSPTCNRGLHRTPHEVSSRLVLGRRRNMPLFASLRSFQKCFLESMEVAVKCRCFNISLTTIIITVFVFLSSSARVRFEAVCWKIKSSDVCMGIQNRPLRIFPQPRLLFNSDDPPPSTLADVQSNVLGGASAAPQPRVHLFTGAWWSTHSWSARPLPSCRSISSRTPRFVCAHMCTCQFGMCIRASKWRRTSGQILVLFWGFYVRALEKYHFSGFQKNPEIYFVASCHV